MNIHTSINVNVDPNQNQAISKIDSHFRQEVIKATLLMYTNRVHESIKTEPIWNNKHIQFKSHCRFYSSWCKAGLAYLQDLWTDGQFIRYENVEQRIGTNGRLLFQYNALINALPERWKVEIENNAHEATASKDVITEIGPLSKLPNKTVRNFFDKLTNHEICAAHFGKRKLDLNVEDYFNIAHECTKESRLRILHFTFIHNNIQHTFCSIK